MQTHKATFYFKSLNCSIGFKLESTNKKSNDQFTAKFLNIFSNQDEQGKFTNPLMYNSEVIKEVFEFIDTLGRVGRFAMREYDYIVTPLMAER